METLALIATGLVLFGIGAWLERRWRRRENEMSPGWRQEMLDHEHRQKRGHSLW